MKNCSTHLNDSKSLGISILLFLGLIFAIMLSGGLQASAQPPNFGPNVTIITPSMTEAQIEAALTNIANDPAFNGSSTYNSNPTQSQFSPSRNAVLFMPGTYTVQAPIGYYTSIAGLGENPGAVVINGFITPEFGPWSNWCSGSCPQVNITQYFWRSMENMTINAATNSDQSSGTDQLQWGVSQGASFRRMQVNGALELTNSWCGDASGGFISDSNVTGQVESCSQQQWYSRNSIYGSWDGGVWNMVFSGVTGAPTPNYPANSFTVIPATPVVREKPFLYVDGGGNYWVFSPSLLTNSWGTSWAGGGIGSGDAGTSLSISTFLIATPSTTLATINAWLATPGQNLILTPGIYQYSGAINVVNANTVVLGLGYADLVPQTGTAALTVADVDGVQIAGLLIDAGPVNSPVLLQVGVAGGPRVSHASNPTSISDVHFRIGGAAAGTCTEAAEIDSDNVIIDNMWSWRADHGTDAGWTGNTAANGLVVNGDNVTALGLAVEHYQQNQVVWNGEGGETIFYQSELPYEVPSQASWMDGAIDGYASYYVAPTVTNHTTYGMGVYSYFDQGVNIVETSGISVPNAAGVTATDSVTVFLAGSGQITYTIDNAGTIEQSGSSPSYVPFYQGVACTTTCPSAPTNLTATVISGSQINLSWTAGATPGALYTIYRGTTSGFTPSVSNQLEAGLTSATTSYHDTAVSPASTYYYVVQAQTLGGTSLSNYAIALTPSEGGVITAEVIEINAGGGAVGAWVADEDFVGGATASTGNTITTTGIVNPAPQAVYQTNRWGTFVYTIPGFTPGGSYIVDLHFAESYWSSPGQRQFNVVINGVQVLTNYDMVAAGGGKYAASKQSFFTTANGSGQIVIQFETGAHDQPQINGIEIGTGTPAAPFGLSATAVSPNQINLIWGGSALAGVTYNIYRSTWSGFTPGPSNLIKTVSTASFADTGTNSGTHAELAANTTYYYVVDTISAGVATPFSNMASATTSKYLPAALSSPTQGATFAGSSQSFTWNSVVGATGYTLFLGSTGVGSNNLLDASTTATTITANNLPVNGETIYARLWTNCNGVWTSNDYTFTAE